MKKHAVLFVLGIGWFLQPFSSPSINLTGRVVTVDSAGVAGANVKLTAAGIETATDSSGAFRLVADPTGHPISAAGFKPVPTTFNGRVVSFGIAEEATNVTIEVYNALGKRIAVPVKKQFPIGNYAFNPFASTVVPLSSGLYVLRVRIGNEVRHFKMTGVSKQRSSGSRNTTSPGGPVLMKMRAEEVKDTLVAAKEGYFEQRVVVDDYEQDVGNVVLVDVPAIPNTENIGNEEIIVLPVSEDGTADKITISKFADPITKPFENDSIISSSLVLSCGGVLRDTNGFVIRIPVELSSLKKPDDLTVFAIIQKDSFSVDLHGFLTRDTLNVRLPVIDSGLIITAAYNPNMVSIDINYDSLENDEGLHKKLATTTDWPTHRWWAAFDPQDGYLKKYAAEHFSITLQSVTNEHINKMLITNLFKPALLMSLRYDALGFRSPEFYPVPNPPRSHIENDLSMGRYDGKYYRFYIITGNNAFAYGFTNYYLFGPVNPIGISLSSYWINRTDPADEIGAVKGIFVHELMHGIIYGYDLDYIIGEGTINSYLASRIYQEAIATVCGHTLDYNSSNIDGIHVRPSPLLLTTPSGTSSSNCHFLLNKPLLQDTGHRYEYHDYFAYCAKKYKDNKLNFLHDLLSTIRSKLPWPTDPNWTMEQYILHNLQSTNSYFNDSLWFYYSDFIRNRAYEHNKASILRTGDPDGERNLRNDLFTFSTNPAPDNVPAMLTKHGQSKKFELLPFSTLPVRFNVDAVPLDTPLTLMVTSESVLIRPDSLQVIFYPEKSGGTENNGGIKIDQQFRWARDGASADTAIVALTELRKNGWVAGTILVMNCAFRKAVGITVELITAPDFTVTVSPAASGPVPLITTFVPSITTENSPVRYWTWDFGDGDSSTYEKASHVYVKKGVYTFVVKAEGPGGYRRKPSNNDITADAYTIVNTSITRQEIKCTGNVCNTAIDAGRQKCIVLDYGTFLSNVDGTFEFLLGGDDNFCLSACSLFISEDKTVWLPLWGTFTGVTADNFRTYTGNIYNEDRLFRYIAAYSPACGMARFDFTIHKKPRAGFSMSPETPAVGDNVSFDASGSTPIDIGKPEDTNIIVYQWDFGDGRIALGQTASHTYERGGTYHVTLSVIDQQNGNDIAGKTVIVTEK